MRTRQCQRGRMGLFACHSVSRREFAIGGTLGLASIPISKAADENVEALDTAPSSASEQPFVRWMRNGPYSIRSLPTLEHTCSTCFPRCSGTSCLTRISVTYPRSLSTEEPTPQAGLGPPFPLAIISSGFLLGCSIYQSYSNMLASHGWTVVRYDRQETLVDYLDDETCVDGIIDLIDWAESDALIKRLADTRTVYLVGHSRGGKLAALASSRDRRIKGLFLIDPVDFHPIYQPISPGFPSSLIALQESKFPVPLAVVGSGRAGDCAPESSNFSRFFEASQGKSLSLEIEQAGHFSFLDDQPLQSLVCPGGETNEGDSGAFEPKTAGYVARSLMVAWGELLVRGTREQPQIVRDERLERQLLPTWSTRDLPQFQEDTLGPRVTEKERALEVQRRARQARRRFLSAGGQQSSDHGAQNLEISMQSIAEKSILHDLNALIEESKSLGGKGVGVSWRGQAKYKGFETAVSY